MMQSTGGTPVAPPAPNARKGRASSPVLNWCQEYLPPLFPAVFGELFSDEERLHLSGRRPKYLYAF
jgi:hypothetical protein